MNQLAANESDLLEALAELEHDQWLHWSQSIAAQVEPALCEKWEHLWGPYADLPDSIKEADRVWARKVIAVLHAKNVLNT
jgi:hypothetical protein